MNRSFRSPLLTSFVFVSATTTLCVLTVHMARPMVTYRAIDLGASPLEIGIVQSAYSILPLFLAIKVGRWVDRYGEGRWLVIGCGSLVLGGLILSLASSLLLFGVGQAFMGFGLMTQGISSQTWIANRSPADRRVHWFGWFAASVSVGQILGPSLGALLVENSETRTRANRLPFTSEFSPFVGSLIVALAALMFACFVWRGHASLNTDRLNWSPTRAAIRKVLRRPGITAAIYVSMTVTSAQDVLLAYLPAYGEAVGLSVATVGTLLSVRAGASLVSRVVMGPLNDWLGLSRLLLVTTGASAVAIAVAPLSDALIALYLGMVVVGFGLGIGQPISIAWIANQTPEDERGLALGLRLTGNWSAVLIVPILMGALAALIGYGAIWIVLAVFLGLASAVTLRANGLG